jgi:DNA polymerase-3 subunit delta
MPSARATLAQMRKKLSRGWPSGLTLLTGEDRYHLDTAEREILEVLAPRESSEFALTIFGDEKTDIATVITAARSIGMFSPRRVVLVKDASMLDGDPEAIKLYANSPPPESYLLVRAPKLDKRLKLYKALRSKGSTTLTFDATKNEREHRTLIPELKELAVKRDLRLKKEAAELLVLAARGDLYRMVAELDKLRDWLGGGGEVTAEMIRKIGSGGGLIAGWEVANAVASRNRSAALTETRRLIDSGEEALRILGGLAWRARVMLQAKGMLDMGISANEVYSALPTWGWKKELVNGMRDYTLQELLAFPALLLQADRRLKSRSLGPRAVLEDLVDRMTRKASAESGAR